MDALRRELAEEVGIEDALPFEGPIAIVDSIAPERSFAAKHVVHIIFSGDLGGRSLEAVTSADAAVRGHRLFALGELDEIVLHPPIQRFLGPLAARRPGRLPRPSVGALAADDRARMLDLVDRRGTSPLSFLIRYEAPWQAHFDGRRRRLLPGGAGGRRSRWSDPLCEPASARRTSLAVVRRGRCGGSGAASA